MTTTDKPVSTAGSPGVVGELSRLDRFLPVWIAAAMVAGLLAGRWIPGLNTGLNAADADGIWTLQTSIFTENRAGIALHHGAGYRTVGVRERIAQLDGV